MKIDEKGGVELMGNFWDRVDAEQQKLIKSNDKLSAYVIKREQIRKEYFKNLEKAVEKNQKYKRVDVLEHAGDEWKFRLVHEFDGSQDVVCSLIWIKDETKPRTKKYKWIDLPSFLETEMRS